MTCFFIINNENEQNPEKNLNAKLNFFICILNFDKLNECFLNLIINSRI